MKTQNFIKALKRYIIAKNNCEKLVYNWNDTSRPFPHKTIHQLIEEQAANAPEKTAVICNNKHLSYKEFNESANRLAAYLRTTYHIQPDDIIAVSMDRGEEFMVTLLAILKAGAAYLPIDPELPLERMRYMLTDATPKVVLAGRTAKEKLGQEFTIECAEEADFCEKLQAMPVNNPEHNTLPHNLMYLLYTSGTTGNPKGVLVQHGGLVNYFHYVKDFMETSEDDIYLAATSFSFDVSVFELFMPFMTGATQVMADKHTVADSFKLLDVMKKEKISIMFATPARYRVLIEAGWNKPLPIKLGTMGEALTPDLLHDLLPVCTYVTNHYGPTEASINATAKMICSKEDGTSIGRPVYNVQTYILNKYLKPVAQGGIGELYIGGAGLGRGYLNRPELTQERFIINPFRTETEKAEGINDRLYKTGDLVRYLPNGDIDYIGRNDFQVKINGHRIEIPEIESRMALYPGLKQPVVLVKERNNSKFLVGYYVEDSPVRQELLLSYLGAYLPQYMIPAMLIPMEIMPLNQNGKLDRKALPEPEFTGRQKYVAPEDEVQWELCSIYADVLGLKTDEISVEDDFFRLGGNSLLTVKLFATIKKKFSTGISITDIVTTRTVKNLAIVIQNHSMEEDTVKLLNSCTASENLFMIHPGGTGCEVYQPIAKRLEEHYSCYGIDSYNFYHLEMIEDLYELAEYYAGYIRQIQEAAGKDTYQLFGWSLGGQIALEIAAILEREGIKDITVYSLDSILDNGDLGRFRVGEIKEEMAIFRDEVMQLGIHASNYERFYKVERDISMQAISKPLEHTKIVLFKAMQYKPTKFAAIKAYNANMSTLEFNNIDIITTYNHQLKVIEMHNSNHVNILLDEETICSEIMDQYDEHLCLEAEQSAY